jgi:hypothetical protein
MDLKGIAGYLNAKHSGLYKIVRIIRKVLRLIGLLAKQNQLPLR